jgi:carboxymethylenebutenolidase
MHDISFILFSLVAIQYTDIFWEAFMKRRNLLLAGTGLVGTLALSEAAVAKPRGRMIKIDAIDPADDPSLQAYYSPPVGNRNAPAVVVFMEVFGLNDNIKGFCDRLAAKGYGVIAPDLYHGQVFPYTNLDGAITKLKTLKDEVVMTEFVRTVDFLRGRPEVQSDGVGVTGFCMGGRYTFMANEVHAKRIKAAVSFYGGGIAAQDDVAGRASLLNQVSSMEAPLMLMYGSEDSYIVAAEHQRIAKALSTAKKRYSLNVFPGAGHGFMNDQRKSYNPAAAAEATAMMMAFFDRHLAGRK